METYAKDKLSTSGPGAPPTEGAHQKFAYAAEVDPKKFVDEFDAKDAEKRSHHKKKDEPAKATATGDTKSEEEALRKRIATFGTRYELEAANKVTGKSSITELKAIEHECIEELSLRRGKRKFRSMYIGICGAIESLCEPHSPIPRLRSVNAKGLTQGVCSGEDFDDIVIDTAVEYGWIFTWLGPGSRFVLQVVTVLSMLNSTGLTRQTAEAANIEASAATREKYPDL